ncbi:MAG: hypothetical protein JKX69_03270 [Rhodobacteraceae bacterium]|nr:hypothetical protein [Paracoccaceae bacterium]
MTPIEHLVALLRQSISAPTQAIRSIIGLGLPRNELFAAMVLVTALSTIVAALTGDLVIMVMPDGELITASVFTFAVVNVSILTIMAFALDMVGRAFGGKGNLDGALIVSIWWQLLSLIAGIALLGADVILGDASWLLRVGVYGLLFWCFLSYISEIHGFNSLLAAFGVVVVALIAIAFGMTILLGFIRMMMASGIGAGGFANV